MTRGSLGGDVLLVATDVVWFAAGVCAEGKMLGAAILLLMGAFFAQGIYVMLEERRGGRDGDGQV